MPHFSNWNCSITCTIAIKTNDLKWNSKKSGQIATLKLNLHLNFFIVRRGILLLLSSYCKLCKALKYYWEYMLLKNRDDFSRYKRWSKSTIYDSWNYAMLLLKYDTALLQQPLGVEALGALQFSTFGFNSLACS